MVLVSFLFETLFFCLDLIVGVIFLAMAIVHPLPSLVVCWLVGQKHQHCLLYLEFPGANDLYVHQLDCVTPHAVCHPPGVSFVVSLYVSHFSAFCIYYLFLMCCIRLSV